MSAITLAAYIASKIPGARLDEWDMAPKSFDFKITHQEENLDSFRIKSLVEEFYRNNKRMCEIDDHLVGKVALDAGNYVISISNCSRTRAIRGTLQFLP